MDAVALLGLGGGHTVDGLADDVEETAVDILAHRHRDGLAEGEDLHTALEAVCGVHGDAAHGVLTDVLLAFEDDGGAVVALHAQGGIDVGKSFAVRECYVHHGANNLRYFTFQFHLLNV